MRLLCLRYHVLREAMALPALRESVPAARPWRLRLGHRQRRGREALGEVGGPEHPEPGRWDGADDHLLRTLAVQCRAHGAL